MVLIKKRHELTNDELAAQEEKKAQEKMGIQDEFQLKGFELLSWMQENSQIVLGGIGVIVIGALGWSGYTYYVGKGETEASVAYYEAVKPVSDPTKQSSKEESAAAQGALAALIQKYNGSKVAGLAHIEAGYLALEQNKADEATKHYEMFLGQANSSNELRPLAMTGLAYAYALSGKKEQALAAFENVVQAKLGVSEDLMLWEALQLATELGQKDKSKKLAEDLTTQYPESPYVSQAKLLLVSL